MDLLDRSENGEEITKEEWAEANEEYESALAKAIETSNAWWQSQVAQENLNNQRNILTISKARQSEKKKLTPLGVPKKETEGGQE